MFMDKLCNIERMYVKEWQKVIKVTLTTINNNIGRQVKLCQIVNKNKIFHDFIDH